MRTIWNVARDLGTALALSAVLLIGLVASFALDTFGNHDVVTFDREIL
jgi:hypothetical protein